MPMQPSPSAETSSVPSRRVCMGPVRTPGCRVSQAAAANRYPPLQKQRRGRTIPPNTALGRRRPTVKGGAIMGLLDALLGGGGREDNHAFLQRFENGPPWEGYSDQEVLKRYGTVAGQASAQEYQQAATDAFGRLSPEQRVEFGRLLQQRAREQHAAVSGLDQSGIKDFQDAQQLARLTGEVHQQPGLLRSLLGEGSGGGQSQQAGLLSNPLAKAALAGIAAMAIKRVLGA